MLVHGSPLVQGVGEEICLVEATRQAVGFERGCGVCVFV